MPAPLAPHPDRLLPTDPGTREIARELYQQVAALPIVSPHGHVPAEWLADNTLFSDPTSLLLTPDHYTNRLLHAAAGVDLAELGVPVGTQLTEAQARAGFRKLCENWRVLRGTPVQFWFESEFHDVFGVDVRPSAETADQIYERIAECLADDAFRPRALYRRFNIEVLATTDDPCSDLAAHRSLAKDPTWDGRVVPTFRPDAYLEPGRPDWGSAGATLVDDVEPFEQRKLWLLNGSHTLMAYAGPILGCETVADGIGHPVLREWVLRWWSEAGPGLQVPWEEYTSRLVERYENPNIRHLLAQIAADGSLKMPVRIAPTLRAFRGRGELPFGAVRAVAAWLLHLRGLGAPVKDVSSTEVLALAKGSLPEAAACVVAHVAPDLACDQELIDAVVAAAGELESLAV